MTLCSLDMHYLSLKEQHSDMKETEVKNHLMTAVLTLISEYHDVLTHKDFQFFKKEIIQNTNIRFSDLVITKLHDFLNTSTALCDRMMFLF